MILEANEGIIITRSEPFAHWREGQVCVQDIEVVQAGAAVQAVLRHLSNPIDPPLRRHTECLVLATTEHIPTGTRLHIRQTQEPGQSSTFHIISRDDAEETPSEAEKEELT